MNQLTRKRDSLEEAALRAAVLAGNERAWRTLYDRCYQPLFAYVDSRTGRHRQRTEEIVQETWLVAVRRIRHFDPERAPFGAWLRGIAERQLRNHFRKWRRREGAECTFDEAVHIDGQASHANSLDENEQVLLALRSLPEHYQSVLGEKYWQGRTVNELAEMRNRSPKAVESLLSRARTAFRKAYRQLDSE